MTPERWSRIKQVFNGALDQPVDRRAAWRREQCGDDGECRAEVEKLAVARLTQDFLDTHYRWSQRTSPASPPDTRRTTSDAAIWRTGERRRKFEIIRPIGRGG